MRPIFIVSLSKNLNKKTLNEINRNKIYGIQTMILVVLLIKLDKIMIILYSII